jgi:hypothetical protein
MSEAEKLAEPKVEKSHSRVLSPPSRIVRLVPSPSRQPQLSDAELTRLRAMMDAFDTVATACPVARRALIP